MLTNTTKTTFTRPKNLKLLKLKYKGDGKFVSFITGEIYRAEKIFDETGEVYAIFDEGDDWYCYSVNFVKKNFDELSGIKLADSSAQISPLA